MPAINHADPRPAHVQMADDLRERINSGEFQQGARLPSTRDMRNEWGVSAATIRRAIDHLSSEGLVTTRQGAGFYVRTPPPRVRRSNMRNQEEKDLALADEDIRRGNGTAESDMGMSINDLDFKPEFEVIDATDHLAALFELDTDRRVLQRTYTTRSFGTGLRLSWSRSWLPVHRIESNPDLLKSEEEPWAGGTPHQLSTVGIEVDRHVDVVTAVPATSNDQQTWGLEEGVGMLHIDGHIYDTTGAIIVVAEVVHPGDRTELVYETQLKRW